MTPESWKTLLQLKSLRVRVYRGLHLNADNTDTVVIDQWIDQHPESPVGLERLLNHIHVNEFFPDVQDESEWRRLSDEIALSWKANLSSIDSRYRVVRYEDYGPQITFYFDRDMPHAG